MFIVSYRVKEFLDNINFTLKETYPLVEVIGEVSEVKEQYKSGHIYFSLKEDQSILFCACWKSYAKGLAHLIKEGEMVKVRGSLASFTNNAKVYLSAIDIVPYGEGSIKKKIEELKSKLDKEGIFDPSKKKSITLFPKKIGLITSMSGAVIDDIKLTLKDKIPLTLEIKDCHMQGVNSIDDIIKGIKIFNQQEDKPDFLIIARGGGSLEDLYHFNSEELIRAIFNSKIPIITAIGHAPDSCLADMVADKYFVTPTASVAFLPSKEHMLQTINHNANSQRMMLISKIENLKNQLDLYQDKLKKPSDIILFRKNSLKNISFKLDLFTKSNIQDKLNYIDNLSQGLKQKNPRLQIENYKLSLSYNDKSLSRYELYLKYKKNNLDVLDKLLENSSVMNSFKRGFSILSIKGKNITSVKDVKNGIYDLQLIDGKLNIQLTKLDK